MFSAGLIEADVRESLSRLRTARLELSQAWRGIERDVSIGLAQWHAARDRAAERRIDVRAARQALAQAEGLQNVGLAVELERLDAQDRLLRAELDLVNAQLDERVVRLDLMRAVGTLERVVGIDRLDLMDPSSEMRRTALD